MSSAWCNCSSASAHELVTNAVKHGSLGRNGGRLMVNWRVEGKDGAKRRLAFEWDEHGSNGELPKPSREGFGMQLLTRMLPYDLSARTSIDFEETGMRFPMELPMHHVRPPRPEKSGGK